MEKKRSYNGLTECPYCSGKCRLSTDMTPEQLWTADSTCASCGAKITIDGAPCQGDAIRAIIEKHNTRPSISCGELKGHSIAQFTNELRDVAKKYHGAEQLRARISGVVAKYIKSVDRG